MPTDTYGLLQNETMAAMEGGKGIPHWPTSNSHVRANCKSDNWGGGTEASKIPLTTIIYIDKDKAIDIAIDIDKDIDIHIDIDIDMR